MEKLELFPVIHSVLESVGTICVSILFINDRVLM